MEETEGQVMSVGDLKPGSRNVNILVKAIGKAEIRDVKSGKDGSDHKVTEVTVGDETGIVLLTLWDDAIDKVNDGQVYQIKNGYTSLFKGNIRLNIGRYGEVQEVTDRDVEVNDTNNVSEKVYEDRRRSFRRGGYDRPRRGFDSGESRGYGSE